MQFCKAHHIGDLSAMAQETPSSLWCNLGWQCPNNPVLGALLRVTHYQSLCIFANKLLLLEFMECWFNLSTLHVVDNGYSRGWLFSLSYCEVPFLYLMRSIALQLTELIRAKHIQVGILWPFLLLTAPAQVPNAKKPGLLYLSMFSCMLGYNITVYIYYRCRHCGYALHTSCSKLLAVKCLFLGNGGKSDVYALLKVISTLFWYVYKLQH